MMFRRKAILVSSLLITGLVLGGCDKVRDQLGLNRTAPDEFRVVSRAPLTVPPEFNLVPPQPGTPRPQVGTPRDQAQRAVTGVATQSPSASDASRTQGENALLTLVGANNNPGDIRALVDREAAQQARESESLVQSLLFWKDPTDNNSLVDAEEESKRLQENATLGRPVNAGEVPTIERKESGIFEDLF